MRILHTIGYLGLAQGGPVESLRVIANKQAELGHNVRIVSTFKPGDGDSPVFNENIEIIKLDSIGPFRFVLNFEKIALSQNFIPDIIHVHGLWNYFCYGSYLIHKNHKVPIVTSLCGMLQADALKISYQKKKIAWMVFFKKFLESNSCLISKSKLELLQIQKKINHDQITIIPNSINRVSFCKDNLKKNQLLFVGRIHPVKNIDNLLEAWSKIAFKDKKKWKLIIAGEINESDKYYQNLIKYVIKKGLQSEVNFVGTKKGKEKEKLFKQSKFFIMPSLFENFGTAILEALSYGLPVICSKETPWEQINHRNCGWHIENDVNSLYNAIKNVLCLSDSEITIMGENSVNLAKKFKTKNVIENLLKIYQDAKLRKI